MAKRGPRGLRPGEFDLWRRVAATAKPLDKTRTAPLRPTPADASTGPKQIPAPPIQPFTIGAKADTAAPPASPKADPIRMDRKAFDRMRRGKSRPDGRIDLHGMTAETAKSALTSYVLSAHAQGKRLVLVITGKGRDREADGPIPLRRGVLRHNVPHWLQSPPLSSVVLQVTEAHRRHGGSGALYVYLRRAR